jgi:PAS domain S-box-containing protein
MQEKPDRELANNTKHSPLLFPILTCLAIAASCTSASLFGFSDAINYNRFGVISNIAIFAAAGLILFASSKNAGFIDLHKVAEPSDSKEHYRALAELSSQIIWMADKDGRVTYFNQRWYDYTGFGMEDSVGDRWIEVLHLDHREKCLSIWQRAVQAGVPYENEYLFRRFDGVYRWHIGKGLPLKDEEGKIVNWFGICLDVHDQRITAAATARIAERLVLAMEAGETGTFEVYPNTAEAIWSDQCRAILGVPKTSEAGTEAILKVAHPEDRKRLKQLMQSLRSDNPPAQVDLEFRVFRPDGELRWIAAKGRSSQDIQLANGKRLTGVVTDVTIRKQAEQERLAFTAHIEAAREKERAHVAREIHDELGQVLTAVKMDVAWIDSRIQSFELLGDVRERANATLSLLDQSIRTVRRISTELRPGVLDDLGLCAAVEWLARNFEIHTRIAPSVHLEIDDAKLPKDCQTALFRVTQEALTNIARHAKATRVEVSLASNDDGFQLTISDNGSGFSTLSNKGGSFGVIGMRERISNLGGQFSVFSSDGQGTTITAILPTAGTSA